MKRLMIVDGQNQFMRSYIVNPTLTYNGEPCGGVVGFLQSMNKFCDQISPDVFVVVWDGAGGSNKRKKKNKNYKSGRKPPKLNKWGSNMSPQQLKNNQIFQQVRVIEYLNQTPVIQFREPGVEADDVISYIKSMPVFQDYQKVIISSDKDFIQLLDEKTILMRPTQGEILNRNRIVEDYSIHPNNFAIARSMVGDKSDNIEGIRGVGLKTVAKCFPFLSESKDYYLEDIYEYSKDVDSNLSIYEKVIAEYQKVCNNYSIMQLSTPLISVQCANRIDQKFEEYKPLFNKTEMNKMLSVDGLTTLNYNCLSVRFNNIINSWGEF